MEEAVVAARDELALRPADDARAVREARADRDVAVAREQRRDERQERAQVGRQVDVHVGDDPRLAPRPGGAQRAAAALALEAQVLDPAQLAAQARAIAGVPSVLALSAITIRHAKGNDSLRNRCRRRMLCSSAASSL